MLGKFNFSFFKWGKQVRHAEEDDGLTQAILQYYPMSWNTDYY